MIGHHNSDKSPRRQSAAEGEENPCNRTLPHAAVDAGAKAAIGFKINIKWEDGLAWAETFLSLYDPQDTETEIRNKAFQAFLNCSKHLRDLGLLGHNPTNEAEREELMAAFDDYCLIVINNNP